jgi:DNA-binding winged helix-turn-helix (wHTH) protein
MIEPHGLLHLGSATFDRDRRVLVVASGPISLAPKEFDLLSLLLAHRPRVVTKEEILSALWPATAVAETSLSTLVNELRGKLGQSGRDGPIRTVHGVGYALADTAEPEVPRETPRLVRGSDQIVLKASETILGRKSGMPGTIHDDSVSRRHARLTWDGAQTTLEDLGSKNGTFLRGARVEGPVVLEDGDEVRIGIVSFVYRAPYLPGDSETKTVV